MFQVELYGCGQQKWRRIYTKCDSYIVLRLCRFFVGVLEGTPFLPHMVLAPDVSLHLVMDILFVSLFGASSSSSTSSIIPFNNWSLKVLSYSFMIHYWRMILFPWQSYMVSIILTLNSFTESVPYLLVHRVLFNFVGSCKLRSHLSSSVISSDCKDIVLTWGTLDVLDQLLCIPIYWELVVVQRGVLSELL
uniref:Ovule protein n=1 Tax=Heterorhabditis bacteriophora TaxID=37862 RepID=A0A1I7WEN2_HETBA